MQMQQKKKIKGFTIIELLVVIAIIAVISGLAIPQFANWSKERAVKNSAERIKDLVISINSQVQRGLYGFAQFNIIPLSDDAGYSFQTNGMLMSKLATNIGETDGWHTFFRRHLLFPDGTIKLPFGSRHCHGSISPWAVSYRRIFCLH